MYLQQVYTVLFEKQMLQIDGGYGLLPSDSMTALTLSFNLWVDALSLSVAGPTVAQLDVFFSSDYL